VNKPINLYYFYLCIHIFLFILFFYFSIFFYLLFLLFFGAGPSSAHMGWARPSQPGPVTGPSQWPGRAKATRVRQATRVAALCKWIKIHLHSMLLISWNRMKGRGSGLPWLAEGDEDDDKIASVWLNHAWQGPLFTFPCVLLSVICVSFASGYLAYYPGFLRRRNKDDGDAGFFFYLQEAIKKTVMLMLVFWVCCLLFSLFLLCILFPLSLFYGFLLFCLSWFFRSLPQFFFVRLCLCLLPCSWSPLPFVAFSSSRFFSLFSLGSAFFFLSVFPPFSPLFMLGSSFVSVQFPLLRLPFAQLL